MIDLLVDAGFTVQQCCRVLNVSSQGYYDYRRRPMSPTMMRREWLTALIREVHVASRGTYGSRRVHAELTKGRGIEVSVNLVGILMHNAGIAGLPGPAKVKRIKGIPTSDDLVERKFARSALDELWVSDITEHRTREGKVFCCCVMDTCSRRIVGWSIDSVQDSQLVVNALDMAIKQRKVRRGGIVHADHGVQGEFNRSSQHLTMMEVSDGSSSTGCGSSRATKDEVPGPPTFPARSRASILARDCEGPVARRGGSGGRCFATGRPAEVPQCWRHATFRSSSPVGALSIVRGA